MDIKHNFSTLLCGAFLFSAVSCSAALFTFEGLPTGRTTPFTYTVDGLSASFSGSASVCDSTGLFTNLTGNVLIQAYCVGAQSGMLSVTFSSDITNLSLNFANQAGPGTLAVTAFENSTQVATGLFSSAVPPGGFNGEGLASISGVFNRVTLSGSTVLALDNFNASAGVPEPSAAAMILGGIALIGAMARRARG